MFQEDEADIEESIRGFGTIVVRGKFGHWSCDDYLKNFYSSEYIN